MALTDSDLVALVRRAEAVVKEATSSLPVANDAMRAAVFAVLVDQAEAEEIEANGNGDF